MNHTISEALKAEVEADIREYLAEIRFQPTGCMSTYVDSIVVVRSNEAFNELLRRPKCYFIDSVFLMFTGERCSLLDENYRSALIVTQQMLRAGFNPIDAVRCSLKPVSDDDLDLNRSILNTEAGVTVMAMLIGLIHAQQAKRKRRSAASGSSAAQEYFSASEVARMLKISRETVTSLIESGQLKGFSASPDNGKRPTYRISKAALEEFESGQLNSRAKGRMPRRRTRDPVERIL